MNIEKLHQLCGETLKFLGRNYQIYLAVEEMAELQKELLKDANRGRSVRDEIIEETADVMIMLEQLINIYQMRQEVTARIDEKLARLDERLEYYRKKEVEDGVVGN